MNLHSFDQACELWYAANKYIIPSLKKKCSEFMWDVLTPQNVCIALEFANLYEDALLKVRPVVTSLFKQFVLMVLFNIGKKS